MELVVVYFCGEIGVYVVFFDSISGCFGVVVCFSRCFGVRLWLCRRWLNWLRCEFVCKLVSFRFVFVFVD